MLLSWSRGATAPPGCPERWGAWGAPGAPALLRYRGAPRLRRGAPSVGGHGGRPEPPIQSEPAAVGLDPVEGEDADAVVRGVVRDRNLEGGGSAGRQRETEPADVLVDDLPRG